MLDFIFFGIIDNGILISCGLLGVSLEKQIENGINWLLRSTTFKVKIKSAGRFGLFCGGIANAVSDFSGGLAVSWSAAIGTFLGCVIVAILVVPLIFEIKSNN